MRKTFLIVLLLVILIGAGFASARFRKAPPSFKPHTIVYKLTIYDEADNLIRTDIVVRQVFADGRWQHTQIEQNGTVHHTKGQLTGPATAQTANANSPEHLNYKYIEEPGHDSRAWASPDLQDFLMFTALRANGSRVSVLEAVNITTP
jgi:hypothetical protein